MHTLSLFIFHRDLRLQDNTGLIQALKNSQEVIAAFIFDEKQLQNNEYRGDNLIQFMLESLEDLQNQLKKYKGKLYLFHGNTQKIIEKLIHKEKIQAIFTNRDYTPFSIKRDNDIKNICKKNNISFNITCDALLNEPEAIHKKDQSPYTVFTPFMKKCRERLPLKPVKNIHTNYYVKPISQEVSNTIFNKILPTKNPNLYIHGGRNIAVKKIQKISEFKNYKENRDIPAKEDGTTGLSAHNKFGTLSIREFYWTVKQHLGTSHTLINELYWRDFFTHINFHFPKVYGNAFHEKYNKLTWKNNKTTFEKWCNGKTGFPIVDAGMRQLNTTGYMHNRVRMIVASFLIKDLHIDWRWGEKYFAQKLIDYDPAVNNGNWQWAASTGCDSQPYFRIFNPWLQQKKFDPECEYIKKWIPELQTTHTKEIHNIWKAPLPENHPYTHPIVEHKIQRNVALSRYKSV